MKFQEASDITLATLYKFLRSSDDDTYLSAKQIKAVMGNKISAAYVTRIASSEQMSELVEGAAFEVDGVPEIRFRISDIGIDYIEKAYPAFVENSTNLNNIPASDRVVKLNHNQINAIDVPTKDIIGSLEADNGLPDEPDFRNIVIGRLKAGREFIRSGIFELEMFRLTMIVGLQMIIERYKEHAIGAAASALLTLILKQLGLDV